MKIDSNIRSLIKTDAGCRQLLKELRFENGKYVCLKCKNTKAYEISGRPGVYECSSCGVQVSLTAGTFFHGKKLPLSKCFALLISHLSGETHSASQLARDIGLWVSTVWRWGQQIRFLVNDVFVDDHCVLVDCDSLRKILFRRSVETPAVGNETYKAAESAPSSDDERLAILETQGFISTHHHGVSKKYAQLYAAEYRFSLRSKEYSLKTLIDLFLRLRPVSIESVSSYSSPELIVLPTRTRD